VTFTGDNQVHTAPNTSHTPTIGSPAPRPATVPETPAPRLSTGRSHPLLHPPTAVSRPVDEPLNPGHIQLITDCLPGVITAAPSREQAAQDVLDALREYLLSLRDIPAPRNEPEAAIDTIQLTIALRGS